MRRDYSDERIDKLEEQLRALKSILQLVIDMVIPNESSKYELVNKIKQMLIKYEGKPGNEYVYYLNDFWQELKNHLALKCYNEKRKKYGIHIKEE